MSESNAPGIEQQDDIRLLTEINENIGFFESQTNAEGLKALEAVLAYTVTDSDGAHVPALAFRRASGKVNSAQDFLGAIQKDIEANKPGISRDTRVDSISFFEQHCAVVICVVTMPSVKDSVQGERKSYRNVRLFIRQENEHGQKEWRLLGWANEQIGAT